MKVNVCVIGAGVIGLSTAVQLTELRLPGVDTRVTLIAEQFSPDTTGDGAAGIWDPSLCGVFTTNSPPPRVAKWSHETFAHNAGLARSADAGAAGASMVTGGTYFSHTVSEPPYWKDIVYNFKQLSEKELSRLPHMKEMGILSANHYQTAVVDCLKYLPWLLKRFLRNGGSVQQKRISRINELAGDYDVVVNCTGIGARDLVPDPMTHAVSGQTVCVEAPWIRHFTIIGNLDEKEDKLLYIIPKASYVVLGGTHDHDQYERTANAKTRERILQDCTKLEPGLKGATILKDWVGLRPSRHEVRLERELLSTDKGRLHVVHNYGHRGSGITLHWGCAMDATDLVRQCVMEMSSKL